MRRDVIRGTWSAVFFPLSIPHWHFRAKTICKRRLQTAKTPENDRFLSKWEKLAWMSPLFLRAFKALLSIEIALVASYLTFPPVGPFWSCWASLRGCIEGFALFLMNHFENARTVR